MRMKRDNERKTEHAVRPLAVAGLIAGAYTALSLVLAPLSFGPVQCRVAEALTLLATLTPAAIPGLTVGCLLTDLIGLSLGANVAGALDVAVGTLATAAAAWLSWRVRNVAWRGFPLLAAVPPILLNAIAVGTELTLLSPAPSVTVWWIEAGLIAAGETVACVAGVLLVKGLRACGAAAWLTGERHSTD